MITKEQIRRIRRGVARMKQPVLTLYSRADQSNPHQTRVRARGTMSSLDVPEEIQSRVLAALDVPQNRAPTAVVFANEDELDLIALTIDLPVIDPQTGHVEARYGDPYLSPLLLALDQYERFAVLLLGRDQVRTFEVYLNEIEELAPAVRGPSPGQWDRLQQGKQTFPAYVPSRDDAAKDRLDHQTLERVRRFYETVGDDLEDTMSSRGADRLILLGPDRDVALFESFASRWLRDRVVAREQGLPDPAAPASTVLERVAPIVERVEADATRRVIDAVDDEGARGTEKSLVELQHGRVHVVVAPWSLDREVFETTDGYVALTEDDARKVANGGNEVRKVRLKDVLPDLVSAYGARLTFARGENERRLNEELGGMGGLLRW